MLAEMLCDDDDDKGDDFFGAADTVALGDSQAHIQIKYRLVYFLLRNEVDRLSSFTEARSSAKNVVWGVLHGEGRGAGEVEGWPGWLSTSNHV